MIRTIKQRIYVVALWPLAILALTLVLFNGISRTRDANQELRNSQQATAALLQSQALDALVVGNTFDYEQAVSRVLRTVPSLVCVTLRDSHQRVLSKSGKCTGTDPMEYFPVRSSSKDLSDYKGSERLGLINGEVGLSMDIASMMRKRRQVAIQLIVSLILIGGVIVLTSQLLRLRLIDPLQRIAGAMRAISERDYSARVQVQGDDELKGLAQAMNNTGTALERHRSDADRSLQDADEANLALGGLVLSLTENLEGPIGGLHEEWVQIAIDNQDLLLRDRIKAVIAKLQAAQADFQDLIEIGNAARDAAPPPARDLADIMAEINQGIEVSSQTEGIAVNLTVTRQPHPEAFNGNQTDLYLDLDGVRLKKVIMYLIRAMARQCTEAGVNVNVQFLKISGDEIYVSLHLTAFYGRRIPPPATPRLEGMGWEENGLAGIGLSDRESRIVKYLLRTIGIAPLASQSFEGPVSILLERTCRYTSEQPVRGRLTFNRSLVSVALVTNDTSLERLAIATRGDMANLEITLVSFAHAPSDWSAFQNQHAVLVDLTDHIGEAHAFVEDLNAQNISAPKIAICPPGRLSEYASSRLIELGFVGIVKKPLYYSRLIEVIRATLSEPLRKLGRE